MLSIFPELLPYNLLGVTLIRVTLGIVILYIGLMTVGVKKNTYQRELKVHEYPLSSVIPIIFGIVEIATGIFLIAGFLTQLMVLIAIYIFINLIFIEKYIGRVFDYPNILYVSLIFISIALLFLGPGVMAVDLPI